MFLHDEEEGIFFEKLAATIPPRHRAVARAWSWGSFFVVMGLFLGGHFGGFGARLVMLAACMGIGVVRVHFLIYMYIVYWIFS